jgi:hypothetical protein
MFGTDWEQRSSCAFGICSVTAALEVVTPTSALKAELHVDYLKLNSMV